MPVGLQFGVVIVPTEGHRIEVATFRRDGVYLDARHPVRPLGREPFKQDEAPLAGRQDVGAAVREGLSIENVGDATDVTGSGVGGFIRVRVGDPEAAVLVHAICEEGAIAGFENVKRL